MIPQVDLHCHLLPDWDDGPDTFAESLQMARRFSEAGCKTIVVTPHVDRSLGRPERSAETIAPAVAALEQQLHENGVDIRLIPGGELHLFTADLSRRVSREPWLSIGGHGHYVLIESPVNSWPSHAPQMLYHLSLAGITPLIAHPERYAEVQKDVTLMAELVDKGVRLQITARSLVGKDRAARRCSEELLRSGLVAVVASDAHNAEATLTHEVVERVVELVGKDAARTILVDNAIAIIEGRPVRKSTSTKGHYIARPRVFSWPRLRRVDEHRLRGTNC